MENIFKSKEKETSPDKIGKIFGIIRKKDNFENSVEASLTFSTEMAKELRNCAIEAEFARAKALMQSLYSTRRL